MEQCGSIGLQAGTRIGRMNHALLAELFHSAGKYHGALAEYAARLRATLASASRHDNLVKRRPREREPGQRAQW